MKNKYIYVLQHHPIETIGAIAGLLQAAGITANVVRSDAGQAVPKEIGEAAGLIVMGGPQSVYEQDKFPYLTDEIRLIEDAMRRDRPVVGVCLGSQLIAATLGAKVYPGRKKELGWHRLTLTDTARTDALWKDVPRNFMALHWHGDIFDLPRGAALLASSAQTAHQGFRYGRGTYGFLFHAEVTFPHVRTMVETFADELSTAGLNGRAITLNAHTHLPELQKIGATVFSRWVAML